jgi:acetolactate synthase-1/3 small subunit
MAKNNQVQTIIVWALNKPGVLNRIFTLIRRRNFNVETISAGHTHNPQISRITISFRGTEKETEQLTKQLYKIVEITKISEGGEKKAVNRELALVKVKFNLKKRKEIMEIIKSFRARAVNFQKKALIIEITGREEKINSFIEIIKPYGIKELARTGRVSMLK